MLERSKCIPPPVDRHHPMISAEAAPPTIDPDRWEDFPGFRETFLLFFTERPANSALRILAAMLYALVLDYAPRFWPSHREGIVRAQLRAAVADLRHLQGFLTQAGQDHVEVDMDWQEGQLSALAGMKAVDVGSIADELEQALARWPSEVA